MKKTILAVAIALSISSIAQAQAQAPQQQQVSPSEAAIQIDSMVNQIAQIATNQSRMIESLQKQIKDQNEQIAELHKLLDAAKASSASPPLPTPAPKP